MSANIWDASAPLAEENVVTPSEDAQISLPHDVMVEIFSRFEVEEVVHTLALVCRGWFALSRRETVWANLCRSRGVEKLPPLISSWRRYFRLEVNRRWDPSILTFKNELSYHDHDREVHKLSRSPDTSIAFLNSRLRPGQRLFVTMRIVKMSDAFLGGVTACPLFTLYSMGWGHLRLPGTWAIWDRRCGIQLNGKACVGPDFPVGSVVGIYVDLVDRLIHFSVDGKRIQGVGHEAHPLLFNVREKIQRLKNVLEGELNTFYDGEWAPSQGTMTDDKKEELARGRANYEGKRETVQAEIARLQLVLDSDPLGNPEDPEEEWAIYAMLDWADDAIRIEDVYRGALADKIFNALPVGFRSTVVVQEDQ